MLHNILSVMAISQDLIRNIKDRILDQKYMYLGEGSDAFYNSADMQLENHKYAPYYVDFILPHLDSSLKGQKIAFISLGCGKDEMSRLIIESLQKEGFEFEYFGIDSSSQMLEKNKVEFKNVSFPVNRVLADFSSYEFKEFLKNIAQEKTYGLRIFSFFGGTIANIPSTNIIETLQNTLQKGDLLWHDAVLQKSESTSDQLDRFNYYLTFCKKEETSKFLLLPLEKYGVPKENGNLYLTVHKEMPAKTLLYVWGFKFTKKTSIEVDGEKIIFLPEEKITLFHIRDYLPDLFIDFITEHHFVFKNFWRGDQFIQTDTIGQFLFERE